MAYFARPHVLVGVTVGLIVAHLLLSPGSAARSREGQPVPVAAASNDDYWGGYVATRGPYSSVAASWTVPSVPCKSGSAGMSTAYVWVGEGGYLQGVASRLIQAGTASDCISGVARYHAFYEWYPGIYASDFPLDVRSGDTVSVRISQGAPGYWTLELRNATTGQRSTTATLETIDSGSADFIVERPTVCSGDAACDQLPLAKFGSVTFRDARVTDEHGVSLDPALGATSMALVNPRNGRVLALPATDRSSRRELAVLWRRGS